jgi:hypothetical protein
MDCSILELSSYWPPQVLFSLLLFFAGLLSLPALFSRRVVPRIDSLPGDNSHSSPLTVEAGGEEVQNEPKSDSECLE